MKAKSENGVWLTSDGKKTNFTLKETACRCGCGTNEMQQDLIDTIQACREMLGKPMTVTSGYRCAAHNSAIGGAPKSKHAEGTAIDIIQPGMSGAELYQALNACGVKIGALIRYEGQRNVHLDTRETKVRLEKTKQGFWITL